MTRGKYDTFEIQRKCRGDFTTRYNVSIFSQFFFQFCFEIQIALHTYLSDSSTLNVGVVVGVGGELCLLTRWFKDVSCTLSRLPRNALLWLANFSLFMGEPRITSSHDASPHITHNCVLYNRSLQRKWL